MDPRIPSPPTTATSRPRLVVDWATWWWILTLQLEGTPSPPAHIMLCFTVLPHQVDLEQVA